MSAWLTPPSECGHCRFPARRAGTPRRSHRPSRHRSPEGRKAVVGSDRRLRSPRFVRPAPDRARPGASRPLSRQSPAAAAELCRRAEAVLRRLPAQGVTRSQLAADVLGDAHALDGGQPTATLVWRSCAGTPMTRNRQQTTMAIHAGTATPGPRQVFWSTNWHARSCCWVCRRGMQATAAIYRESPLRLLRSLLRSPPAWDVADRTVFVCENPNLLAIAADQSGGRLRAPGLHRWHARCRAEVSSFAAHKGGRVALLPW